jgi:uncharacterized cupin superfamily protein
MPIRASDLPAQPGQSVYPEPFARRVAGRSKRKLGDLFGLKNFGVNLTTLEPGAVSALLHTHTVQDEFVYVIEGRPTVVIGDAEYELSPGECIGFAAGTGLAHQVINRTHEQVAYIEIGDRTAGEQVDYPQDDIAASQTPDGTWLMTHKDGTPY